MGFLMPSPWKHPKTSVWYYRRAVPVRLREALGRTEYRISLHTKDIKEAKRRYPDVAAKVDAEFIAAEGGPVRLTNEQVYALAGEWLKRELEKQRADPGDPDTYDILLTAMQEDEEKGREAKNVSDEMAALLQSEALVIDRDTRERLAPRIFWNKLRLFNGLKQMAHGNYGQDADLKSLPAWEHPAKSKGISKAAVPLNDLFTAWVTERKPVKRTEYERKRFVDRLEAFVGHDDAAKLTKADLVKWKDALLAENRNTKTVTNHLIHLHALFAWAVRNERLASNPAAGVSVTEASTKRKARLPYSDDDAKALLQSARTMKGFRRWVPWLLAYTGARLEEVCQSNASDIRQENGIWHLDINQDDDGKHLKMGEENARKVPLHPHLISEGFLDYLKAVPKKGLLFPDVTPDRFGKRGGNVSKTLGRWVRLQGITDKRKVPNHSWRHRFKDLCRHAEIEKSIHDALTGHKSSDEGDKYGLGYPLAVLDTAIKKLPKQC